jgi:hypothetical protein
LNFEAMLRQMVLIAMKPYVPVPLAIDQKEAPAARWEPPR